MKRLLAGLLSITLMFSCISVNALELSTNETMEVNKNVDDVNISEEETFNESEIINQGIEENHSYNVENDEVVTLANSSETSHDCNKYLTTKYNSTQHWQECSICGKKYNISTHSFSSYWTLGDSCSSSNKQVSTCSCGYSYTTPNTRQHKDVGNYEVEHELYQHAKWCRACGERVESARCRKADGSLISCTNLGTCTTCGTVYSHAWHHQFVDSTFSGDVICNWCSKKIATISNSKTTYNYSNNILYATNTYSLIPAEVNMTNTTTSPYFYLGCWRPTGLEETFHTYTRNTLNGAIDVSLKIGMTAYYQTEVQAHSQVCNMGFNDGSTARVIVSFSMKPDITAPIISSVTSTDVASKNLENVTWSTGKNITIKGTEEYSQSVVITFKDSKGNILATGTTNVVNNNYSYTFTPDIEANASGANYTIIVTDKLGNSTSKTLTFYRVDKKAPIITSSNASATNWTKSKTIIFTATDAGVGNVKFGIDSTSYEQSISNNNTYSISKTFSNDVYGSKNITIYAKDALDNTSSQVFTLSNIDNTKPTITKVEGSKSIASTSLTVTANDINTTLNKNGSGVSKYIITSTNATPSENDANWQTSNVLKVTTPGIYYIFAKDLVGNISSSYKVDVKINYTLTVNPNGGTWNNSTNNQTFSLTNGTGKTISNPTKNGYTFKGWTLSGTGSSFKDSTFTMGTTNASLTANWVANTLTINYHADGATKFINPDSKVQMDISGKDIINTQIANYDTVYAYGADGFSWTNSGLWDVSRLTKEGYSSGNAWYVGKKGSSLTISDKTTFISAQEIAKAAGKNLEIGNVVIDIYPVWTLRNYSITYNLNGGTISGQKTSYTIESTTFTLPVPTKTGYTFVGWTGSNGTTKQTSVSIAKGSTGNKTYNANYTINQYDVTYIDVINSTSGTQLGKTTKKVNYNSNVRGSDLGNSTSDSAYHNGYYYVSDTSAIVSINGATVYRIFKLRTVDKTSNLTWNDNNNKNGFRPSKYTLKLLRNGSVFKQIELSSSQTSYTYSNLDKYDSNGKAYTYTFQVDANSDRYKMSIDGNGNITEDYQNSTFSVIIPKKISLNGNTGKGSYNIKVDGTFYYNDTLTVIPSNSFKMIDKSGISNINASVSQDTTTFTKSNLASTKGTISLSKAEFAGSYTGTFNFAIKFTMKN